jgi:hypothetical protein
MMEYSRRSRLFSNNAQLLVLAFHKMQYRTMEADMDAFISESISISEYLFHVISMIHFLGRR